MIGKARQIVLILGDIFFAYFSLFLTIFFRYWGNFSWQTFNLHLLPFSFIYIFWLFCFYIFDLYNLNLTKRKFLFYPRLFGALGIGGAFAVIFFYLIPFFGITPKTNLVLNILIFGVLLALWRRIFFALFSSLAGSPVGILGLNPKTQELAKEILKRPYLGYKLKVFFTKRKQKSTLPSLSRIKTLKLDDNLFLKLQKEKIDTLILGEDIRKDKFLIKTLSKCLGQKISFLSFDRAYEIVTQKIPVTYLDQIWFLENLKEGEKRIYDKVKRGIDICLSFFILLITLPLWFFISLAIFCEDRGPIFYRQKRVGKDKKIFWLMKFRSMKPEAEKNGKARWAEKKDSRVTKVGKILRRFHLDELPQMINALKGEISLVGPRPERPEFVKKLEKEIPYYHLRHIIKPGFTGWAQIKFRYARSVLDSFEKFQYDLYYIKNRSFLFDLSILLKTLQLFFRKEK